MKLRCLTLSLAILAMAADARADGDAVKGQEYFRQRCAVCHSLERNVNKVGPSLLGIIDQAPASLRSFNYSEAMKAFAAGGRTWDDATLAAFLAHPRGAVPGTSMAFAGTKRPGDIADVIAFLHYYSRQ